MNTLIVAILRIAGLALSVLGVIALVGILANVGEVARAGLINGMGGQTLAIQAMLDGVYPIVLGLAVFALGEGVSLLRQIRDRSAGA